MTTELVGRGPELAALAELVRTLRRGGTLAVVEGEAGIGKTRLVQAASELARAAGVRVLAGRGEELEVRRPFAPLVDCLGHERLERHLGDWEVRPDAAAERQFRVAETVLERLDALSARAPVLLVVEDLHWADPATLAVLARVAAGIAAVPAGLLITLRPQPRPAPLDALLGALTARGALILRLGPLDERAGAELVAGLIGTPPGPRLARQAGRAAGNPLFVRELVEALQAAGAIRDGELASAGPAPALPLTILHRLSFLPRDSLDLLGLAAVLGASFDAADLALLAGRPLTELLGPLRAARRAGVVVERGERLAFRHELVRDALYEDMPLSVRRGLHEQAAAALTAAGRPPERVAEHLLRGAHPGDERAVARLAATARELAGRAPGAAVDLYRQAIALAPDPAAARDRLLAELAEALVAAGALGEGEAACREALTVREDAGLRLHLMFLLLRRSRAAEAVRVGAQSTAPGPRLRALLAMARVFAGELESGAAGARAVLAAPGDEVAAALATNALAMAAEARGAFAEAAELIAPNVAWAERSGSRAAHDTRPHMIRGLMLTRLDRLDEAHATIQRGRHSAEALGLADAVATYHYQLAFVDFVRGRLDDALAELATHEELSEQTASGWRLPAASLRALIELHRGDLLTAERHVAEAEREAAAGAPPHGSELLALARAGLREAAGDLAGAADALAADFATLAAGRLAVVGPELARLAARAGRVVPDVAPALAAVAARNPGARSLRAAALRARGDAASRSEALALLRETGRALETARAAEDAGELAEARVLYARCGAARDLARVDAALRADGARRGATGPRRRPASGWDALTDTELKVVRLVAERLTNPEIAERMFISRRTVQTHVSHALAKLGVASRRDLAAAAARQAGWRLRLDDVGEQPQQLEPAGERPRRPALDGDDA